MQYAYSGILHAHLDMTVRYGFCGLGCQWRQDVKGPLMVSVRKEQVFYSVALSKTDQVYGRYSWRFRRQVVW